MSENDTPQDTHVEESDQSTPEISEERRAELEARGEEIKGQLAELAQERDAVLAGLEEIETELGAEAAAAIAGDSGFDTGTHAAQLESQIEAANEERLRLLADMQNQQRRAAQNERTAEQQGQKAAVQKLLGVLDHFDLTLGHVDPEQASAKQVLDGVEVIRKEMVSVLNTMGVEVIRPGAGEAFDPHLHQAIAQQPSEEQEPNTILHIARAGYTIEGKVIRPAEVVVVAGAVES